MPAGSSAELRQVAAADFNGDGKTDLAVVVGWEAAGDPSLSLLFGNGDGTFGPAATFTASPADASTRQAAAVDDFFRRHIRHRAAYQHLPLLCDNFGEYLYRLDAGQNPAHHHLAGSAAITNPAPLSATQLNATASVAGTFVYNPPIGTVLTAGTQTLAVTFTPTGTADYSPAEAMVTLTVNPAPPVTYALTASTKTITGSSNVTLSLYSVNYAGTVSFATSVTSANGTAADVTASAPPVTLTDGGSATTILTITAGPGAANHVPLAPWSSGGLFVFGAVLLGAPFTLRRSASWPSC